MLRLAAQILSVVFHPLLGLTYMLVLLLLINPYLFGVNSITEDFALIAITLFSTFVVPGLVVVMMKMLGLIQSVEMEDRHDRIIPYIATGIFYLPMYLFFLHNGKVPLAYASFVLGSIIALFTAFFINLFTKISAHAVGMGGLVGMMVITRAFFSYETFTLHLNWGGAIQMSTNFILMLVIALAGMVGTSRLLLNAHEPKDLYGGYLVGFAAQFVALIFLF